MRRQLMRKVLTWHAEEPKEHEGEQEANNDA